MQVLWSGEALQAFTVSFNLGVLLSFRHVQVDLLPRKERFQQNERS